jgi:hypothetical protein
MPSTYAHRRFGADVLALLPDGLRQTLEQHRELYDMGLHGPDLMFYYKALQTNPVNRLGNAMHEEKGEVFFTRARAVVEHAADKDAALAYALGLSATSRWTAPVTLMWRPMSGRAAWATARSRRSLTTL